MSNAAYIQKLNTSQKAVKEGSAKMIAQFWIGAVPLFLDRRHNVLRNVIYKTEPYKVKGISQT
jgi:hypothetical protein